MGRDSAQKAGYRKTTQNSLDIGFPWVAKNVYSLDRELFGFSWATLFSTTVMLENHRVKFEKAAKIKALTVFEVGSYLGSIPSCPGHMWAGR